MNEAEIIGIGAYAPEKIVSNDFLSTIVDTSDEWIYSRTGIKNRRIAENENTSDQAAKAALKALKDAGMEASELELIVVATVSPDNFVPSCACMVQGIIGADKAMAFDINAACSGFIFALNIASQFIKTGQVQNALVIGAETLSKITDWSDRGTCVLFGDGAGAVVLKKSEKNKVISIYTGTDGSKGENLTAVALPLNGSFPSGKKDWNYFINMNGREIFKFATKVIEESIEKVLEDAGLTIENIKYIVPHQANMRIIEFVAGRMKISADKFYMNIENYGNTSSASIPLALNELYEKGMIEKGDKLIMVGFGGGLSWGAALIEW